MFCTSDPLTAAVLGIVFILSIQYKLEGQQYFQQEVHHEIHTKLDARRHLLHSHIRTEYINRAPDTLFEIYMHLWPNAYRSKTTALARQFLETDRTTFHFAGDDALGGIDSLDFKVDSADVAWKLSPGDPDIAVLYLNEALPPGEGVIIETPFRVRIPESFSRLGRVGSSYQLTQWYPKPAVYDQTGWHPMPYLNQGEFYSEFGRFDVSITVPEAYRIAATGTLHTIAERQALTGQKRSKQVETSQDRFEEDNPALKTLHYTAENVHDFAWFADPRFQVEMRQSTLPSGRIVEIWAFLRDNQSLDGKRALDFLERSLRFFSDQVGPYPYPQFTIVQAPGSRGINMEYPMLTVIGTQGDSLYFDGLIAHEVAHNWFYGVLASNERDHAWIDEGLASYYENRYMKAYHNQPLESVLLPPLPMHTRLSETQLVLLDQSRKQQLQAPATTSAEQSQGNYLLGVYQKSAMAFALLEKYLGTTVFDQIMQSFFSRWQFKHPGPDDLRMHFEAHSGRDLSWFFDGLINSAGLIDYGIVGYEPTMRKLTVRNRGEVAAPLNLIGRDAGHDAFDFWVEGFEGDKTIRLPEGPIDTVLLYRFGQSLDVQTGDNLLRNRNGRYRFGKPVGGGWFFGYDQGPASRVYGLPLLLWNDYDKLMPGLVLYNGIFPTRPFQFMLSPTFSTSTRSLAGMYHVRYAVFFEKAPIHKLTLGLTGRSFHYNRNPHYDFFDRYIKTAPYLELQFKKRDPRQPVSYRASYRFVRIDQQYGQGIDFETREFETRKRHYAVHSVELERRNTRILNAYKTQISAHAGAGFVRLTLDHTQKILYHPKKAVYLHFFAGWLPEYDAPKANVVFRSSGTAGPGFAAQDYLFDELLPGRTTRDGILGQQIFARDARLKTVANIGISNDWMVGFGASAATPLPAFIQPYIDCAVYPDPFGDGLKFLYSGGISLVLWKGIAEMYFPLLESPDIETSIAYADRKSVLQRMTFTLNLNRLEPYRSVDAFVDRYFY